LDNSTWKESSLLPSGRFGNELSDSSSSETEKESHGIVHFVLGDGPEESFATCGKTVPCKDKSGIVRSYSQDTNMLFSEDRITFPPKTSYSENSLNVSDRSNYRSTTALTTATTTTTTATMTTTTATTTTTTTAMTTMTTAMMTTMTTTMTTTTTTMTTAMTMTTSVKKPLRELPIVMSIDDETLSTDSNSTADNDELKRRRRKLHFPAFRKNKAKVT